MTVEAIHNFIRIEDHVITGGQPTAAQFEAAKQAGVEAVINLSPANAESHYLPEQDAILRALDMNYFHIPVAWTAPTLADFETFCATMDRLEGKHVIVHCAANFRVTAFYSRYAMVRLGWSAERANALTAKIWESIPGYGMDDIWRTFLVEIDARMER